MPDRIIYICHNCATIVYRPADDDSPVACSKCRCILKRRMQLEPREEDEDKDKDRD